MRLKICGYFESVALVSPTPTFARNVGLKTIVTLFCLSGGATATYTLEVPIWNEMFNYYRNLRGTLLSLGHRKK